MSSSSSLKLNSRPAFARCLPNNQSLAIVSTYLLDQTSDSRSGSLCLIEVDSTDQIYLKDEIKTPSGVFRFEYQNPSCVVAALTDGSLIVQNILDSKTSDITQVSSDMLLDVGLSNSSLTITSDNKGQAYLVDLNTNLIISSWLAHSLPFMNNEGCEVWSCSINQSANVVITGGEDSTLKLWDPRTRTNIGQCKLFDVGVVFVDFHSEDEQQIISGSYDEFVRIIDKRNMKSSIVEKKLNGGVWNIEKNKDGNQYCVACMYGGYVILDDKLGIIRQNEQAGQQLLYGATQMQNGHVLFSTFNDYMVKLDK